MAKPYLHKVIKNVRTRDGRTHKQTYYVRQAAPGDVYSNKSDDNSSNYYNYSRGSKPEAEDSDVPQQDDSSETNLNTQDAATVQDAKGNEYQVEPLTMPWELWGMDKDRANDPVPSEVRRRFDGSNKSLRYQDKMGASTPFYTLTPGEDLMWGVVEKDLLNRMRTGMINNVRPSQAGGYVLAKIEGSDGIVDRAYVKFEGLTNDKLYDLYGDMYGFQRGRGDISKRAAAAYEVAKAAGFDDLVPPTVYRCDQHDGLEPIITADALDQFANILGVKKEQLLLHLGDAASVEVWSEDTVPLIDTLDFRDIVNDSNLVVNFWSNLNDIHKMALMRTAIYDYLTWNGSRTWMDITSCPNARHPLHLTNNSLVLPNPIAQGIAYLDYQSTYTEGCPDNIPYMPMLWSDPLLMLAMRGDSDEEDLFDKIGYTTAKRLQGDNVINIVRCLNDHGIEELAIAGLLIRAAFLRYGARQIMRDPLIVARYFSSIITSEPFDPGFEIDLDSMVESVNKAVNNSIFSKFDFIELMTKGGQDEQEASDQQLRSKEYDSDSYVAGFKYTQR